MHPVIRIHSHPNAPAKPAEGATCNGCGVCCLAEPCPIGMLISRKRAGACDALEWADADQRYRCGMVVNARAYLPAPLRPAARLIQRWAQRMISAGSGCDCGFEV